MSLSDRTEQRIYDSMMYPDPEPRIPVNKFGIRDWNILEAKEAEIVGQDRQAMRNGDYASLGKNLGISQQNAQKLGQFQQQVGTVGSAGFANETDCGISQGPDS